MIKKPMNTQKFASRRFLQNFLLSILILLHPLSSTCTKGCLKCTTDNQCLLCDTTEKYKLQDNKCIEFTPKKCNKIDLNGNCLTCSSNHYLDPTDKTCQQVETAKSKSQCIQYDSSMNCASCKRDYYVNSGNCVAVTTLIKNCEINQTEKLCKICERNYLLSLDRKSCVSQTQINNCQYWSTVVCQECNSNYIKNKNLYFKQWFSQQSYSEKMDLLQKVYNFKFGITQMKTFNVCQLIEISHCIEYETYDRCKTCEDNYFLDQDKHCINYPKEKIKYCQNYESPTNCIECQQGYYLKNNSCDPVVTISNCAKYDPKESTSKCIECTADYVLSGTACTKRHSSDGNNIQYCKDKHLTEDKCESCQENYVISTDGLKCFATVLNCLEHAQVGSTSQNFQCKICKNDYFLNEKTCESGSVSNCKIFSAITTCTECENQYFLATPSTCSKSKDIANCLLYDGKNEKAHHTCTVCQNNTFNFKIQKYCKDIDIILNCKSYKRDATTATCEECNPGFFKVSDTTCNAFQDTNCTRGSGVNHCTYCNAQFSLDLTTTTPTCRTPHEYVIQNCASHSAMSSNNLSIGSVTCQFCKPNFYPWSVKLGYVCIKDDYLVIEQLSSEDLVENCHKYNVNNEQPELQHYCILCKEGFVLSLNADSKYQCTTECPFNFSKLLHEYKKESEKFEVITANTCIETSKFQEGCKIFGSPTFSTYYSDQTPRENSVQICLECKNFSLIPFDFSEKLISNQNPKSNTFNDLALDPLWATQKVSCLTEPVKVNNKGGNFAIQIANCQYYTQHSDTTKQDEIFCIKCSHGFYGKIVEEDGQSFIDSCLQYDQCEINTVYHNLHPFYLNSASCHKCNENNLPFVPLNINSTDYKVEGLAAYHLKSPNFKDFTNANGLNDHQYSVMCLNPDSQSSFGDSFLFQSFPDHCGLGVINLNSQDGDSSDSILANPDKSPNKKLAIFCGSCQPGYQPSYFHQDYQHIVYKCEFIENCSTSEQNYFNACSVCSDGFTFKFDTLTENIVYTECIKHASINCYAALPQSNSLDGFCKICKKGYVMNKDSFCEEIIAAKCSTSLGSVIWNSQVDNLVLNYKIFSLPAGNGCNTCASGYTALQRLTDETVCSVSPYIKLNASSFEFQSDQQTNSVYIKNCEGYTLNFDSGSTTDQTLKCMSCFSSYILNQNGTSCLNTVPNCVLASSTNDEQCAECEEGYAHINDTCQQGNIANCAKYETKISFNTIKCQACNSGYYSDSNKTLCKLGIVPNCKVYIENNSKQCSECETGFAKISKENDICYPIEPQLNCQNAIIESKKDEVMCSECKLTNQILVQPNNNTGSTENQTICMRYNLVLNCESYDIKKDISSSTFLCIKCKSGYYLKDYNCLKRDVLSPSCAIYEISENKCKTCATGNYLINSGKECEPYPTGIIGCRIFTNNILCQACKANRYLSNNECIQVPPDSQIDSCLYYSSSTTCSECNSGYVLNSGKCSQANAQNCDKFTSIDACASCKVNYGLKTENGKTNCISVNKANCISFEPRGQFKCLQCAATYFPNFEGECQKANPLIFGCVLYSSNDECIQCQQDMALSQNSKCVDQVEIVAQIDPNCKISKVLDRPVCSACQPGYFFNDVKCQSCANNKIEKGCFSCDPDLNDTCLICNTGYYMDKEGTCISNQPIGGNTLPSLNDYFISQILFWVLCLHLL